MADACATCPKYAFGFMKAEKKLPTIDPPSTALVLAGTPKIIV